MTDQQQTFRWIAGADSPPRGAYDADIIILSLDRAKATIAAIHSALSQADVATHLFVLDQGSSPETLNRFAAALSGQRRATLLAASTNFGVAGGRNILSSLGHGRIIIALDNDAEFAAPDTVARMVASLDAEPRLAAIGCRIVRYSDGEDDQSSWGYPPGLLACSGESFDAVTYVGAGHAIRRAAWQEVGGYDDRLFFCWEEFDFCRRAIACGWRIRYRGDIQVRHRVSAERRVAWSEDRWFYFVRNRLYIERKLGVGWPALAPRVAGYLLKAMRHGLLTDTLHAIAAAQRMSPRRRQSPIPIAARLYITRSDVLHRGSLLRRVRKEALGRLESNALPTAK